MLNYILSLKSGITNCKYKLFYEEFIFKHSSKEWTNINHEKCMANVFPSMIIMELHSTVILLKLFTTYKCDTKT